MVRRSDHMYSHVDFQTAGEVTDPQDFYFEESSTGDSATRSKAPFPQSIYPTAMDLNSVIISAENFDSKRSDLPFLTMLPVTGSNINYAGPLLGTVTVGALVDGHLVATTGSRCLWQRADNLVGEGPLKVMPKITINGLILGLTVLLIYVR